MKQRSNPLDWFDVSDGEIKVDEFPDGSFSFSVELSDSKLPIEIYMKTTLPEAIIGLHQVVYAIRYQKPDAIIELHVQTMPDQRADRSERPGQCVAAVVSASAIAVLAVDDFVIYDPHSAACVNAMEEMIRANGNVQHLTVEKPIDCFLDALYDSEKYGAYSLQTANVDVVVAVDKGATERAQQVQDHFGSVIIQADKKRVEGKVVGHVITGATGKINPDDTVWIVDDLCDGGATFISIAKVLRETYQFGELNLYVTHGLFSRGKEELSKYYDNILSKWDYSAE